MASRLCTAEKVKVNDDFVKSAKTVKVGDTVALKVIPIWRTYKILDIPKSRLGAKLVADYLIETTSEEDLEMLRQVEESNRQNRMMGFRGRPTKRDRRKLDRFNT